MAKRTVKLNVPELDSLELEILGFKFDVLKSDIEVMIRAAEIEEKAAAFAKKMPNAEEIKVAIYEGIGIIDEILGDGATVKLAKGKPPNFPWIVEIMNQVVGAVLEDMNTAFASDYGLNFDLQKKQQEQIAPQGDA